MYVSRTGTNYIQLTEMGDDILSILLISLDFVASVDAISESWSSSVPTGGQNQQRKVECCEALASR